MGSITDTSASSVEAIRLPVIDISNPDLEVGKQMLDAATKYGFLYINTKGTGFTRENVDRAFELSQQFFSSPEEQKQVCKAVVGNRGWVSMHSELLDPKKQRRGDFKEAMNIFEFDQDGKQQQPMPQVFQGHEDELYAFQNLCRSTCHKILDVLALGLEVDEPKFFSSRHGLPSGTALRMLHYPPVPTDVEIEDGVDIRAGAHSDYGSITLLFQRLGQPGLEIKSPEDTWAPVPVLPEGYNSNFPPILVNIADLLSYWTNGLLKSTVHRVIFPTDAALGGEHRYSIAYFCHPTNDCNLIAIPSQIVQAMKPIEDGQEIGYGGGAASKRALTAKEHLENRLTATYGHKVTI